MWSFKSLSITSTQSFILFRSGYYLGSAYWPLFINDPEFKVSFASSLEPLPQVQDTDLTNSTAPLGIIRHPSGKLIVSFVFTLSPLSNFRIIEGGFPQGFPPENASAVRVKSLGLRNFDLKCDPGHEELWNEIVTQRRRDYRAYSPNPSRFRALLLEPIDPMPEQTGLPFKDEVELDPPES
ncbi:MAG: hypothetical protein M1587_07555 [Thaumarchaeota archaeon]|nr:hypothetical protein [Nitrososphaerota archaeon]MDG6906253.1 hypothetical protein [Nitrososphaerota archaeon]